MTTDIREICDLSDEDRETRRASLHKRLFVFVRRRQELPDGLALYFDETPEMRAELDEFVEYERGCCSSIGWSVRSESGALRLEIKGIDPRSAAFATAGSVATEPSDTKQPGLWPRLLRSIGFGSVGAVLVCCVLPLGVMAVVGATPLLLLDNPWVIGASALGLGGFLWHREGRHKKRRAAGESAAGCIC